ncbi:MAG: phosphodiester glycosidase family protein [Burkholderiales bacterium]
MKRTLLTLVLVLVALGGFGALDLGQHTVAAARPPACKKLEFEQALFTVCNFDSRTQTISLLSTGTPSTKAFARSRLQASKLSFAMNAGMFHSDGTPVGLLVINGRAVAPLNVSEGNGNFFWKPNGVFSVDLDGTVRATTTDAFIAGGFQRSAVSAAQSGPMLVIDGALHPGMPPDSIHVQTRNAVAECGRFLANFIITESAVSFGKLARFIRDRLGCRNALYLDGAISSLWWPEGGRKDVAHRISTVVAVMRR